MSRSLRLGALALFAVAALAAMPGGESRSADAPRSAEQLLTTTDGLRIYQIVDLNNRTARAMTDSGRGRVALPDGDYRLSNGGAIKVRGGVIVWDAFGAIERLNAGASRSGPDPAG